MGELQDQGTRAFLSVSIKLFCVLTQLLQMSAEFKRQLPRKIFFHAELGWLNHQTYYQAAIGM